MKLKKKISKSKKRNNKKNKRCTKKQKGGEYNSNNYNIQLDAHLKSILVGKLEPIYATLNTSSFYKDIYLPIYNDKIKSKKELFNSGTKQKPIITNNSNKPEGNMRPQKLIQYSIDPFHKKSNNVNHYYIWWVSNLEKYGPETKTWRIMEDLKYCFINILTSIINSYLKYGFTGDQKIANSELEAFLKILNNIDYENSEFIYFIKIFKSYCDWYDVRIKKNYPCVDKLLNVIENSKYTIALPMATILAPERYIRLFSAPIIPFIVKHTVTHDFFKHPCENYLHDVTEHGKLFKISKTLKEKRDIITYYKNVNDFIIKFSKQINKYDAGKKRLFYGGLFDLIHEHDGLVISTKLFKINNERLHVYKYITPKKINKLYRKNKNKIFENDYESPYKKNEINNNPSENIHQNKYDIMYNRGILRGLQYLINEYEKDKDKTKMEYETNLTHDQGTLEGEEFIEFLSIIKKSLEGIDTSLPPSL